MRYLILGDGDFSFSLTFLRKFQAYVHYAYSISSSSSRSSSSSSSSSPSLQSYNGAEVMITNNTSDAHEEVGINNDHDIFREPILLVATSFDSLESLREKYKDIDAILKEIKRFNHQQRENRIDDVINTSSNTNSNSNGGSGGVHKIKDFMLPSIRVVLLHNIDATGSLSIQLQREFDLHDISNLGFEEYLDFSALRFDEVIFNFPHLGFEDCVAHASMVAHIVYACKNVMSSLSSSSSSSRPPSPSYLTISLVENQFSLWEAERMATKHLLHIHDTVPLKHIFWSGSVYCKLCSVADEGIKSFTDGYVFRRHQTGKSFSSRVKNTFNYVFAYHNEQAISKSSSDDVTTPMDPRKDSKSILRRLYNSDIARFSDISRKSSYNDSSDKPTVLVDARSHNKSTDKKEVLKKRKMYVLSENLIKQQINDDDIVWECLVCSKNFSTEIASRTHCYNTHILARDRRDDIVGNDSSHFVRGDYKDHAKGARFNDEEVCESTIDNSSSINSNSSNNNNNDSSCYIDSSCSSINSNSNSNSRNSTNSNKDEPSMINDSMLTFICDVCKRSFKTSQSLKEHSISKHTQGGFEISKSELGVGFTRSSVVQYVAPRIDNGGVSSSSSGSSCDGGGGSKMVTSDDIKRYLPPLSSPSSFDVGKERQATLFSCLICNLNFHSEGALDEHVRSGWQPVSEEEIVTRTSTNVNLLDHSRSSSSIVSDKSDRDPFPVPAVSSLADTTLSCSICSKVFKELRARNQHMNYCIIKSRSQTTAESNL